ncbi:MAG: S1-like domain-containing RNA-binding protein [Tissierellia bacterium]|nr:S1-like domain-containing RNA-binding protein [Tissierellia bacterium]
MIKLGEIQELEVAKKVDFGVYLKSPDDEEGKEKILLPIKQVPKDTNIGDKINVFVYKDSNDRIISTTTRPKIVLGEIAYLKVVEITRIGAFLNWGLEKDLFLPYKEQIGEIRTNGEYMVGLYIDKSDRLCATMNLYKVLRTDSPYKVNDVVTGTVFSLRRGLGAIVAVDGKYLGLIHEGEILKPLRPGSTVEVRVSHIKEDGKLDLSLKDAPRLQIDMDGEKIFSKLAKNKGFLPLNDDSDPEKISELLSMSKSSFKKAVGRLMKKGVVAMTKDGIKLVEGDNKVSNKIYTRGNNNINKGRSNDRDNKRNTNKNNRNK